MHANLKARFMRPAAAMIALLLGFALVGAAIAQAIQANSDSQELPVYSPGIAYGVIDELGQAILTPGMLYPDDNPPETTALSPNAPNASFSYYFVSGATLVARSSSASYTYDSLGCVYVGTDGLVLNTDLQLPGRLGDQVPTPVLQRYEQPGVHHRLYLQVPAF